MRCVILLYRWRWFLGKGSSADTPHGQPTDNDTLDEDNPAQAGFINSLFSELIGPDFDGTGKVGEQLGKILRGEQLLDQMDDKLQEHEEDIEEEENKSFEGMETSLDIMERSIEVSGKSTTSPRESTPQLFHFGATESRASFDSTGKEKTSPRKEAEDPFRLRGISTCSSRRWRARPITEKRSGERV